MKFSEICKKIDESYYYIFESDIEKILIEMIPIKYSNGEKLHYCWANFKQCHRLKLKIRATDEFYGIMAEYLSEMNIMVLFAIDADCISEERLMLIEINQLMDLLKIFYWELDEIYIFGRTYDWLISVNHIFEINIIGDRLIECSKNIISYNKIEKLIIDINEYR